MIRGVFFIASKTDNILGEIFKDLDVKKYHWYNIENQNEVYCAPFGDRTFTFNVCDGKTFLSHINSEHYVIFIKLQAYLKDGVFSYIHTYEDFFVSDCQLLLLIYDCKYVEVFTKDETLAKTIYESASKNSCEEIEYITESNYYRKKMDVL